MAGPNAEYKSIQEVFASARFVVPAYQRSYAWGEKQWEDLWSDLISLLERGNGDDTEHYLGTIVLLRKGEQITSGGRVEPVFEVVDGQQRLVSLLLLAAAFARATENSDISKALWEDFVFGKEQTAKITLEDPDDNAFLNKMLAVWRDGKDLSGIASQVGTTGQKQLYAAAKKFYDKARAWMEGRSMEGRSEEEVTRLLACLRGRFKVLRFLVDDFTMAVRTFHSVNDRGKPLTLLEKTKSLLMLYASQNLSGEERERCLREIRDDFSAAFKAYDRAIELANDLRVSYLCDARYRFNEDELLRYLYHLTVRDYNTQYDYNPSSEAIFERLKGVCKQASEQASGEKTRGLFTKISSDLKRVSQALRSLLERAKRDSAMKEFLAFQSPDAAVYPLIVGLEAEQKLSDAVLKVVRVLDLRVYQVRGTNPRATLYRETVSHLKHLSEQQIIKNIRGFVEYYGSDDQIAYLLAGKVFGQGFCKYVLWRFLTKDHPNLDWSLYRRCEVEHILSRTPSLDPTTYGFDSGEEYEEKIHTFGNLTLLESKLNKQTRNYSPADKTRFYRQSALEYNRLLAERIAQKGFRKENIETRTREIVDFFKREWRL